MWAKRKTKTYLNIVMTHKNINPSAKNPKYIEFLHTGVKNVWLRKVRSWYDIFKSFVNQELTVDNFDH